MASPTQRSLALLREQGWTATICEHWNAFARIRQDLFGLWDILAVKDDETLVVQTTSYSNVSKRIQKIAEADITPKLRKAGWNLVVHGWKRGKNGRWQVRVVDVS